MEEKDIVELVDSSGSKTSIEVVTYLTSLDKTKNYVVYTKGEVRGEAMNHVIYISRIQKSGDNYEIDEITSDDEWADVQRLLKRIANSD